MSLDNDLRPSNFTFLSRALQEEMENQDYQALQVILYVYTESLGICFGANILSLQEVREPSKSRSPIDEINLIFQLLDPLFVCLFT